MVETEFLRPDTDHTPAVEYDDGKCNGVEHCLGV